MISLDNLDNLLSNAHSRQIRETGVLLAQICRGESHFSQKWLLANVGESGESSQKSQPDLVSIEKGLDFKNLNQKPVLSKN